MESISTANSLEDFRHALGLAELPPTFWLQIDLPARSGHKFQLAACRSDGSSVLDWRVFLGKQTPIFSCRDSGAGINGLGLPKFSLAYGIEWLDQVATRLESRWEGPLEVSEEGFEPSVRPSVEAWLSPLMQRWLVAKAKVPGRRASRAKPAWRGGQ